MEQFDIITGASGFIASHLKEHAPLSLGIDRIPSVYTDVKMDLVLSDVQMKCRYLYHLAAVADVKAAVDNPIETYLSNIASTARLINSVDYELLIFTSTIGVLDPLLNPYTLSKYICEEMIKSSHRPYLIFRLANVYGQRSKSVISKFIDEESIEIYGGSQLRDFVYVDDVINILSQVQDIPVNQTLYIGTGKPTSINSLVDIIEQHIPHKSKTILPMRDYEIIKPMIKTDFECKTILKEGIIKCLSKKT